MNTPYILPLADPNATLETLGGKGLSLAKMSRAGLPIPNGFHISTEAYRQFVAANDLQSTILTALKEVDVSTPASLETAAATIARLFPESNLPKEISDAIRDAYLTPVAVRSSATAEDLPEASFAGQQPGEVLVAPITTPAWTPLFAMASAIVTDVGGPLSHGSIVAREYGIPAVLGTGLPRGGFRMGRRSS